MIKSKLDNDILLPELPGCFMPLNVSPSQNNLDKLRILQVKEALPNIFLKNEEIAKNFKISSIIYQTHDEKSDCVPADNSGEVLYGESCK